MKCSEAEIFVGFSSAAPLADRQYTISFLCMVIWRYCFYELGRVESNGMWKWVQSAVWHVIRGECTTLELLTPEHAS